MGELDGSLLELTGYRLRRTTGAAMSKINDVFAQFGLRRTTFSTLALVVDNPGLRQSQLAEALAIERPNFVQIIDELEAAGLVERKPAPRDRRAYAITATAQGRSCLAKAMAKVRDMDQRLCAGLSEKEMKAFWHALKIIDANSRQLENDDEL